MSDMTIRAAADNLRRIMDEAHASGPGYAYTLGAVGQAAEIALRELDAFLALSRVERMRIMDAHLARVRARLLDAMEASEAFGLAIEERRRALGDWPPPEPHEARRTGGVS